jgi:hypothetical protein
LIVERIRCTLTAAPREGGGQGVRLSIYHRVDGLTQFSSSLISGFHRQAISGGVSELSGSAPDIF